MLQRCFDAYDELLEIEYVITIGRRNEERKLEIKFEKEAFKHILGLHYLKDIRDLHNSSSIIFDSIKTC